MGGRRQLSTGLTDERNALAYANKLEGASERARKAGDFTEQQARKALQEIAATVGGIAFSSESAADFLKRHLKTRRTEAPRTVKRRRQVLNDFAAHLGNKAQEPIECVHTRDVKTWVHSQIKRGVTIKTANGLLSFINQAMKDAISEGLIRDNPCGGCRMNNGKRQTTRRQHYTLEQFGSMLKATDGEWKTLITLAALTGQRQKDCARLKWGQVDFKKGTITFKREKNDDEWTVSMVSMLAEHMHSIFKQAPREYVMPGMATRPATGRNSISDVFRMEIQGPVIRTAVLWTMTAFPKPSVWV